MKICILGTGYVGLVTGACLAAEERLTGEDAHLHEVTCVDIDESRIIALRNGRMPFYEPGLEELVRELSALGALKFAVSAEPAAKGALDTADVIFIAVGTPEDDDGKPDLSQVMGTAGMICGSLGCDRPPPTIVLKSTCPPGTAERIQEMLHTHWAPEFWHMAVNPEFLREGSAINDFFSPARIVIGTESEQARKVLTELYAPLMGNCAGVMVYKEGGLDRMLTVRRPPQLLFMSSRSAELSKYASNAMLATRISFANEMARFCEHTGANVDDVLRVVGSDPRIGPEFLRPGIGYGGSCLPKDVAALTEMLGAPLLDGVRMENANALKWPVRKIHQHFGTLSKRLDRPPLKLAVLGLTFKPGTDDLRASPAVETLRHLRVTQDHVRVYDPMVKVLPADLSSPNITLASGLYSALDGADALLLLTEWGEFTIGLDLERARAIMAPSPVIFDGRNALDPARCRAAGFTYYGVGRK